MEAEGLALYQRKVQEAVQLQQDRLEQLYSYKQQLSTTHQLLAELPQKLQHKIAVPFGRHAFFLGNLQNTNEVRVHLGCGYYIHCTAYEATGIIQRRLDKLASTVSAGEKTLDEHEARLKVSSSGSVIPGAAADGDEVLDIREDEGEATISAKPAPQAMPAVQRKPLPQETCEFIDRVINGALQQEEAEDEPTASSMAESTAFQDSLAGQTPARQSEELEYDSDDEDIEFQSVSLQQEEDDDSEDMNDMFAPIIFTGAKKSQERSSRHAIQTPTISTAQPPTAQSQSDSALQQQHFKDETESSLRTTSSRPTSAAFKKGFLLSQPKKPATPIVISGTSKKMEDTIAATLKGQEDQPGKQKEAAELEKARQEAFTGMIVERNSPAATAPKSTAQSQPGKEGPSIQPKAFIPEIVERPMASISSVPVKATVVDDNAQASTAAAAPRVSKFKLRRNAEQLYSLD